MEQIKFSVKQYGESVSSKHYELYEKNINNVKHLFFDCCLQNLELDFSEIDNVVFSVDPGNIIMCGENCRVEYFGFSVKLKSEKLNLLHDGRLIDLLGHIQSNPHPIFWWREDQEIFIKVGCQSHSLDFWKEHYEQIAEEYQFRQDLIPEFLQHLETIEASLVA